MVKGLPRNMRERDSWFNNENVPFGTVVKIYERLSSVQIQVDEQ